MCVRARLRQFLRWFFGEWDRLAEQTCDVYAVSVVLWKVFFSFGLEPYENELREVGGLSSEAACGLMQENSQYHDVAMHCDFSS